MKRVFDPDSLVTPGFVLMMGQVLGYLLAMVCLNTFIGAGGPNILLKSWSFVIVFILAIASGVVFEMLVYRRFVSRPVVENIETGLAEDVREELRVADSPRWHFIIAALIGLSFGVAMAGLFNWWHGQP